MQKPTRKDTDRNAPQEVDRYLAEIPDEYRAALESVREIVSAMVPDATERVSYGVPIFRLNKDLLGYGANKNFCSLHVMSSKILERRKEELKDFKMSGTTIHFHPAQPLSRALIEMIVSDRLGELQS